MACRSQASILVLLELRKQCPEVFQKLEVYVDGGFERGSDMLKALALGARAVGVGRPFLYSLLYGQEGVEHLSQSKCPLTLSYPLRVYSLRIIWLTVFEIVLKDELETSMRLAGVTTLQEVTSRLVNTRDIDHLVASEDDYADDFKTNLRSKL